MAGIRLENLNKQFGKHVAVNDVSLKIRDKELMVFLGPSGCGKSTTLNCIAGLEEPTSGRIYFDDMDVTDVPAHRRDVAMVFQSSLLYPHMTGYQNIRMSLRLSKLSKSEEKNKISEVAKILEITHVLDRVPSKMSGGERQRTAIAKAIVREPVVFLMDEPLANLDASLREILRAEIAVLQKRLGTTMVFVTHDQVEAMTIGDRISVMYKGEFQQVGSPEEIYNEPANTFVAGFIGSPPMRLFEGILNIQNEIPVFQTKQFAVELLPETMAMITESKVDKNIILGIRPEHMFLSNEDSKYSFGAEVFAVERLGKEAVVIVTDGHGERCKIVTPPDIDLNMGETVNIGIQREGIVFFDSKSKANCKLLAKSST